VSWEPLRGETVVGDVRVLRGALDRDVYAYLPPSHALGDTRFPVLYLHDGQNLFDDALAPNGEWQVDETMEELAREGIEAIVVGIPNAGGRRAEEYVGDARDEYLELVLDVKRTVDATLATRADRGHTFVGGSSFGAMVSLAALLRHGDVFGGAALLSPAFWWDATVYDEVRDAPFVPARLWMDVGDSEGDPPEASRYVEGYQRMLDVLRSKGYDVRGYVDRGGVHHETAWARRFPEVVRFLLAVAG